MLLICFLEKVCDRVPLCFCCLLLLFLRLLLFFFFLFFLLSFLLFLSSSLLGQLLFLLHFLLNLFHSSLPLILVVIIRFLRGLAIISLHKLLICSAILQFFGIHLLHFISRILLFPM